MVILFLLGFLFLLGGIIAVIFVLVEDAKKER